MVFTLLISGEYIYIVTRNTKENQYKVKLNSEKNIETNDIEEDLTYVRDLILKIVESYLKPNLTKQQFI